MFTVGALAGSYNRFAQRTHTRSLSNIQKKNKGPIGTRTLGRFQSSNYSANGPGEGGWGAECLFGLLALLFCVGYTMPTTQYFFFVLIDRLLHLGMVMVYRTIWLVVFMQDCIVFFFHSSNDPITESDITSDLSCSSDRCWSKTCSGTMVALCSYM